MSKFNVQQFSRSIRTAIVKHSPEILTGIGITGMISAVILAVTETPKALDLIEQAKKEKQDELTKVEIVKAVWKCYIPTVVTTTVSAACLIGANSVNVKRNAALATAYALSETALREYRDKVVETVGPKKEQEIRDAVAKEQVKKNPVQTNTVLITGKGETLCYDVISGRYFKSDIDKIRKIENELNKKMLNEMYISLNEFYYELGLPGIKIGDDLGWNVNRDYIDLGFSSQLTEDGTPALVINYDVAPIADFREY